MPPAGVILHKEGRSAGRLPIPHHNAGRVVVKRWDRRGEPMIERKERKPYWRHTKWQMLTSLLPFLLALVVLPLYAEQLNARKFLGFPLGYFLACHGLLLIAIITVFSHINRQDAIDHWHGAHEDL